MDESQNSSTPNLTNALPKGHPINPPGKPVLEYSKYPDPLASRISFTAARIAHLNSKYGVDISPYVNCSTDPVTLPQGLPTNLPDPVTLPQGHPINLPGKPVLEYCKYPDPLARKKSFTAARIAYLSSKFGVDISEYVNCSTDPVTIPQGLPTNLPDPVTLPQGLSTNLPDPVTLPQGHPINLPGKPVLEYCKYPDSLAREKSFTAAEIADFSSKIGFDISEYVNCSTDPVTIPQGLPTNLPDPVSLPQGPSTNLPEPVILPQGLPINQPDPVTLPQGLPTNLPDPVTLPQGLPTNLPDPVTLPQGLSTNLPEPVILPQGLPIIQSDFSSKHGIDISPLVNCYTDTATLEPGGRTREEYLNSTSSMDLVKTLGLEAPWGLVHRITDVTVVLPEDATRRTAIVKTVPHRLSSYIQSLHLVYTANTPPVAQKDDKGLAVDLVSFASPTLVLSPTPHSRDVFPPKQWTTNLSQLYCQAETTAHETVNGYSSTVRKKMELERQYHLLTAPDESVGARPS
jgi:hypothetical protein